jgi:hypothetical protein
MIQSMYPHSSFARGHGYTLRTKRSRDTAHFLEPTIATSWFALREMQAPVAGNPARSSVSEPAHGARSPSGRSLGRAPLINSQEIVQTNGASSPEDGSHRRLGQQRIRRIECRHVVFPGVPYPIILMVAIAVAVSIILSHGSCPCRKFNRAGS